MQELAQTLKVGQTMMIHPVIEKVLLLDQVVAIVVLHQDLAIPVPTLVRIIREIMGEVLIRMAIIITVIIMGEIITEVNTTTTAVVANIGTVITTEIATKSLSIYEVSK